MDGLISLFARSLLLYAASNFNGLFLNPRRVGQADGGAFSSVANIFKTNIEAL